MIQFRAKNPSVIDLLEPFLIDEPNYPRAQFVEHLKHYMTDFAEDFIAEVVFEETEPVCFILGYVPNDRSHLFVVQAYADSALANTEVFKNVLTTVEDFARSKGLKEVRAETQRSPKAFERKYGYEVLSTVISKKLEDKK